MSAENVELVRQSVEAFARGDLDAWVANFDPDVLVRTDPQWPEQRMYGRAAVLDWGRSVKDSVGSDLRIEQSLDLGDRVLIRVCMNTLGRESGSRASCAGRN